ncbi:MAG TPA: sulfatase [Gemmatimonadales bacterium]
MTTRSPVAGIRLVGFGLWLGLIFGFIEAGQAVISFLVPGALDWRTATGIPVLYVAPLVYGAAFAAIAVAITIAARWLPRFPWDTLLVGLLALLGGFFAARLHPLLFGILTSWLLGLGIAAVAVRAYAGRREHWIGTALRTLPVLLGLVVVAAVGVWIGGMIRERVMLSALKVPPTDRPNVVLLVMDTQRADHLSLYGYSRPTSPRLEQLAAQGWLFDNAIASAPWTLPSHATMMTGRPLHEHRAGVNQRPYLDHRYQTVAEALRSEGYATGGFAANIFWCGRRTGLDRGFIHYEDYFANPGDAITRTVLGRWLAWHLFPVFVGLDIPGRQSAESINERVLRWIDGLGGRPFFVFANYLDVHEPFRPPAPYAGRFREGKTEARHGTEVDIGGLADQVSTRSPERVQEDIDAYDESIQYLDAQLGALFDALRERRLLENTLVIVTSDHGTGFGEHGLFSHGHSLYRDQVSIPLILYWSGKLTPRRVPTMVGLYQIAPTIAEAAGLPATLFPAKSLLADSDSLGLVVAEVAGRPNLATRFPISRGWLAAVVSPRFKYIKSESGTAELYSRSDSAELTNLVADTAYAPVVADLAAQLDSLSRPIQ